MLWEIAIGIPRAWQATLLAVFVLLVWRLWTFTATHIFWPSRPKELPYYIPFLGHVYSFFFSSFELMERGLSYTYRSHEPLSIQLPGRKLYIITRPEDVSEVFNNKTHTLDHDSTLRETLLAFGVTLEGSKRAWRSRDTGDRPFPHDHTSDAPRTAAQPAQSLINWIRDSFRKHLMNPQTLYEMADLFRDSLLESFSSERLEQYIATGSSQNSIPVYTFLRHAMVEASVRSIFGQHLHEVDPECVQNMLAFNDHAWQIVMRYPTFFGLSSVSKPYNTMMRTMRAFVQRPLSDNDGANPLIKNVLRGMEVAELDTQSRAAVILMIFWAATSNEYNALFWIISHLMHDPALLEVVRRETDAAWSMNGSCLDTKHLKKGCPTLNAVFHEILRHKNAAGTMRLVKSTTLIGGKTLKPGNLAYVPFRQLHNNEAVWGPACNDFDHTRFLDKNKAMMRNPAFRPFGGGQTHCTGRTLAKLEVFSAVAILLRRFEVKLAQTSDGSFPSLPALDTQTISLGINGPVRGSDLLIEISNK
ncbi:cytochrome P450 [Coniella lustricola]|uniref:Cytochrome P450 n=1 Tax=Coniella lustricola TaxID=2025994 RepID=A0A2T3AGL9_9PEZI|nr:cytochrome P450 [Coniella lustricola]